jgi:hypothetical protein
MIRLLALRSFIDVWARAIPLSGPRGLTGKAQAKTQPGRKPRRESIASVAARLLHTIKRKYIVRAGRSLLVTSHRRSAISQARLVSLVAVGVNAPILTIREQASALASLASVRHGFDGGRHVDQRPPRQGGRAT